MHDKKNLEAILYAIRYTLEHDASAHSKLTEEEIIFSEALNRSKYIINEMLQGNIIASTWDVEDILGQDEELSIEQAREVLARLEQEHDATRGINWDVIDATIDLVK